MYEIRPDRERIDGVGVVIILLGVVRCIVALASGNPEHMVFGTIAGVAFAAIGGMVFWLNHYDTRRTLEPQPTERRTP